MPGSVNRRGMLRQSACALLAATAACKTVKDSPVQKTDAASRRNEGAATGTRISRPKPLQEPSRLACGSGQLGHLRTSTLVIWDVTSWTQKASIAVENPKGVGALADGSLLVMDTPTALKGAVRLRRLRSAEASAAEYRGALSWPPFGLARIFPAANAEEFLLISPGSHYSVEQCALAAHSEARLVASIPMASDEYRSMASLGPGAIGHFFSDAIVKLTFPPNKQTFPLPPEVAALHHITPGPQPDQVWVSDANEAILLLELGSPCRVLRKIQPGATVVYNLAGSGAHAAALLLTVSPAGVPQSITLAVYHQDGRELWRSGLTPEQAASFRSIAVGPHFVAVAGEETIAAWQLEDGRQLLK